MKRTLLLVNWENILPRFLEDSLSELEPFGLQTIKWGNFSVSDCQLGVPDKDFLRGRFSWRYQLQKARWLAKKHLLKFHHQAASLSLLLIGGRDKIVFTLLASKIGLKVFWLEYPNSEPELPNPLKKNYKQLKKEARLIVLTNHQKEQLLKENPAISQIIVASPGIEPEEYRYQNSFWDKFARLNSPLSSRRFLAIGVITPLDSQEKIKLLFKAIQKSLNFVPQIHLIIVGSGAFSPENNPWIKWLAKQMKIDNLVWFINRPEPIKKWINGFDLLVNISPSLSVFDFHHSLLAMRAGVPVVAPEGIGYEDIIVSGKTGFLFNGLNSDDLAEKIIFLLKNRRLRSQITEQAQKAVKKQFSLERQRQTFAQIFLA
ncbi:glycosyltransferase [Candidatus Parcubacteria bacterium]|nr:MAG: glycosyltransferase [Candidatus Parcubacteria bacterium]